VRVGVLAEQLAAPVPGGTGRYTASLLAALDEGSLAQDRLTFVTAWHADGAMVALHESLPAGRPVRRLPVGRRLLARLWERGSGPRLTGFDVVHAPTLLVPVLGAGRLVVTVHDAVPWTHPETLTPRGVSFHKRMAARAAASAAAVLTPTRAVADQLLAVLPALAADRVHVLPPGLDPLLGQWLAHGPAEEDSVAARLDLPPEGFVLFVGTREPRKGLDVLLQAMARPSAPPLPLLVVGPPGWGGVDVAADAQAAGLGERVRVLGRLGDAALATCYRRAHVLAVPSRAEGFGFPVLEGLAAGVPVVTSADPALLETGAGAVLSVPVGDADALAVALARSVGGGDDVAERVSRGRRRAAAATWSDAATRLWQLYRELGAGDPVR